MPRRILTEREEAQQQRDLEERYSDRISQQWARHNEDIIIINPPTAEETEKALLDEAYELKRLRAGYKKIL